MDRRPAGQPDGGEFAPKAKSEPDIGHTRLYSRDENSDLGT